MPMGEAACFISCILSQMAKPLSPDHISTLQPALGLSINHSVSYPWSYLKVSPMLGAQLGEELRWVWDVALENCLQPGQGREGGVKSETRYGVA